MLERLAAFARGSSQSGAPIAHRDVDAGSPDLVEDGARAEPTEAPTTAPRVGDRFGTFASVLPADNEWRLPGVRADAGAVGPFWVAAASISGLAHRHKGTTGQDAYHIALTEKSLSAAVADGVGSRPLTGQIGAEIASRRICAALSAVPFAQMRGAARETFADAVLRTNAEMSRIRELGFGEIADRDIETTLAFCWIPRGDPTWLAAARIGDCQMFILRGGLVEPIFERGEGALNEVAGVLPARDPVRLLEVRTVELASSAAVILSTDGLAGDVAGSPTVTQWLAERWARPCGVHWMIETMRYRRQGSHDDRTALVLWPDHRTRLPTTS